MNYLIDGIKSAWHNKKMIFILYAFNLTLGIVVMLPFKTILDNFAGHSLMGKSLADKIDLEFVIEFFAHNQGVSSLLMSLFLLVGTMYWLGELFLSGGAYGILISGQPFSSKTYWEYAGAYWWRLFRLFLWSIPIFAILYSLQFVETAFVRIVFGKDPYGNILFWGSAVKTGLGYMGIMLYFLVLDYAQIFLISNDVHKTRHALWKGISFVVSNFFSTFTLSLILFLIGIIGLLTYNPISGALQSSGGFIVLALLIVQQLYIVFRMLMRIVYYASQTALYKNKIPAPQPQAQEIAPDGSLLEPGLETP